MTEAFNTRFENDVVCWSSLANICVIIWNKTPTIENLDKVNEWTRQLIRENPSGIGCLVISRAPNPPEKHIADHGSKQVLDIQDSMLALAALQEQNGILSMLVRVTLQTMLALGVGRSPFPKKLFGKQEDAASWLSATLETQGKLQVGNAHLHQELKALSSRYTLARA